MVAYIDSSALLAVLLGEHGREGCLSSVELGVASEIIRLECLRTLDRLRFLGHLGAKDLEALHSRLHQSLRPFEMVKLSPLVLGMAGQPFPTSLGTLDAIHLASAMLYKQSRPDLTELVFLTFDSQLARGARAMGFVVPEHLCSKDLI